MGVGGWGGGAGGKEQILRLGYTQILAVSDCVKFWKTVYQH